MDERRGELPLACTLDAGEGRERLQRWRRLCEAALISAQQPSDAVVVTFHASQQAQAELAALAELERACCPFLAWTVTGQAGALTLRITAAAGAAPEVASSQMRILAHELGVQ